MALIKITDSSFDQDVLKSTLPVLVDFYADWCGPCKMAEPILDELSEIYKGKLNLVKINVDENQATSGKYGVMSIPTTILFKDGIEIGRQVGFGGKLAFEDLIKKGMGWFLMPQDTPTTDSTTVTPVADPKVVVATSAPVAPAMPAETPMPAETVTTEVPTPEVPTSVMTEPVAETPVTETPTV